MRGIKLKDIFIIGICVLVVYLFFNNSGSDNSPDVKPTPTISISIPVITSSSTYAPSPTPISSALNLITLNQY